MAKNKVVCLRLHLLRRTVVRRKAILHSQTKGQTSSSRSTLRGA